MSEFSETYHLRTSKQKEGVELLERAGLHGYVYPTKSDWIMLLVEGQMFEASPELVSNNNGSVLIHVIYAEDHGWSCEFYAGPQKVATILQTWDPKDSFELSADFVNTVSAILAFPAE